MGRLLDKMRLVKLALQGSQLETVESSTADDYYPRKWSPDWATETVDEVLMRKGMQLYRDMDEGDDMISSSLSMLKFACLACKTEIVPGGPSEEDDNVAACLRANIDDLSGGGQGRFLLEVLDALGMGFCAIEKVYGKPNTYGDWKGKQFLRLMVPLPQETVTFKPKAAGELENDGVWQAKPPTIVASRAPGDFVKMSREKFVVWSWRRRWANPLGVSMLKPAYKPYFVKGKLVDWHAAYMERFGHPWVIAKTKAGTSKTARESLVRKLRNFIASQVLALPADGELQIEWPKAETTQQFLESIQYYDRAIARSLLMPATLLELGQTGSLALATAQKSTFEWPLEHLHGSLAKEVMQEQVFRQWTDLNFGPNYPTPKFVFKSYSEPDMVRITTAIKTLYEIGLPIPLSYLHELTGIPEPEEGEETLDDIKKARAEEYGLPGTNNPFQQRGGDGQEPDDEEEPADPNDPEAAKEQAALEAAIVDVIEQQVESFKGNGRHRRDLERIVRTGRVSVR